MKNKEIEELLNNFQEVLDNPITTDECYNGRIIEIDRSYDLEQDEIKLLLSYIEQLEKRNKEIYEGFIAVGDERCEYAIKCEQLENNRDKAIEVIDLITPELWNISNAMTYKLKDIKYILKGENDE